MIENIYYIVGGITGLLVGFAYGYIFGERKCRNSEELKRIFANQNREAKYE